MNLATNIDHNANEYIKILQNQKLDIIIDPSLEMVPTDGVSEYLIRQRKKFFPALNGYLLEWNTRKIKLKRRSYQNHPRLGTLISLKADFTVFRPEVGGKLQGLVVQVRPGFLKCRTMEIFLAIVERNSSIQFGVGDVIEFSYQSLEHSQGSPLCVIYGDSPKHLPQLADAVPAEEQSPSGTCSVDTKSFTTLPSMTPIEKKTKKRQVETPGERTILSGEAGGALSSSPKKKKIPGKTNSLPDGWSRKRNQTERSSWTTYIGPDGKICKTVRQIHEYINKCSAMH